jgi:hypothetical protein
MDAPARRRHIPCLRRRVRRLLSREPPQEPTRVPAAPTSQRLVVAGSWPSKIARLVSIAAVVIALGYLLANRHLLSRRFAEVGGSPGSAGQSALTTTVTFAPAPHSIAVLPFLNMSGDARRCITHISTRKPSRHFRTRWRSTQIFQRSM